MQKIIKLTLVTLLGLSLLSSTALADADKGQKIYSKKLKASCGMKGSDFASRHTQDEWRDIFEAGQLDDEIRNTCQGVELKEKAIPFIYDFVYEYASDSGNVPSC